MLRAKGKYIYFFVYLIQRTINDTWNEFFSVELSVYYNYSKVLNYSEASQFTRIMLILVNFKIIKGRRRLQNFPEKKLILSSKTNFFRMIFFIEIIEKGQLCQK